MHKKLCSLVKYKLHIGEPLRLHRSNLFLLTTIQNRRHIHPSQQQLGFSCLETETPFPSPIYQYDKKAKHVQTKQSSRQAAPNMGHPWALVSLCSLGTQPQAQPPSSGCLTYLPQWKHRMPDNLPGGLGDLLQGVLGVWNEPPQLLCKKQGRSRALGVCYQPTFQQAANAELCTPTRP